MQRTWRDYAGALGVFALTMAVIWSWGMVGAAIGAHDDPPIEDGPADSALGIYLSTGIGTSMEPTLSPGDRALCLSWVDYQEGDIVVADGNATGSSHDVRHRVLELDDDRVILQGDNNDSPDDPVSRDDIVCTVVWHE